MISHDEYTDYSCSTSIERLARDVETHLRAWHLVGTDRHVSFAHENLDGSLLRSRYAFITRSSSLQGMGSERSLSSGTSSSRILDDTETALTSNHHSHGYMGRGRHHRHRHRQYEIQLIRSEEVVWTVALADGGKASVPLTLALWDGPSNRDLNASGQLPQSLRRVPLHHMPTDTFANFSTLLGIGQHLTLSLKDEGVSPDVEWALGGSVISRHDDKMMAQWIVTSSLSSILQAALQSAVSNVLCRIPAFGVWGQYYPDQQVKPSWAPQKKGLYPSWLTPSKAVPARRRTRIFESNKHLNRSYLPPMVSANLLGGATFWISILPSRVSSNRLTVWGNLLLQHSETSSVLLCGAKHMYTWKKPEPPSKTMSSGLFGTTTTTTTQIQTVGEWRINTVVDVDEKSTDGDDVAHYQLQCCQYAVSLLELSTGAHPAEPLWGPPDDPIKVVHVTVTWNGKKGDADSPECSLLTMPLRIRSRRTMSRRDWIDMEDSVEKTILDPLSPSRFVVQTQYDREVSMTPLAASQRCMLACLVRAATLPHTIMLPELTDDSLVDSWASTDTELAAMHLVEQSRVSKMTRQLIEAMDWSTIADEMMEGWEAAYKVGKAMNGVSCLGFPSPPEELFGPDGIQEDPFDCLPRSAPPGRLLSVLFFQMSKLRSPSAMTQVWLTFVADVRERWDKRETLPNMVYVPGLDNSPDEISRMNTFSTISLKADNSAFLNSSEPDPDVHHCLIGQKLQVFNIGIELTMAHEMKEAERLEGMLHVTSAESHQVDGIDNSCGISVASTEQMNNIGAPDATRTTIESQSTTRELEESPTKESYQRLVDAYPLEDLAEQSQSSTSSKVEFHDAKSLLSGSVLSSGSVDMDMTERDPLTNVAQRQNRKGARCPVPRVNLVASGDQLYAPYLQRPAPLTDDVILERRTMLTRQKALGSTETESIQNRMEIAHRLQKPKLLSDMRAFQAANPGAIFQDFISWYGNPGSPLEEYGVEGEDEEGGSKRSVAVKLDKAAQAIQVLNATRNFWSNTWDEATPCAAVDQEPLFDPAAQVEIVLDYLETLHPANLLNQVMAVNLSMSYFVLLASAGDAILVVVVSQAMERLRTGVERALELLARDAVYGTSSQEEEFSKERLPRHASVEAIQACDGACDALSETETILSRAMSLLHKFPRKYDLVHNILRRGDGDTIPLTHPRGRASILQAIRKQQGTEGGDRLPRPSLREYVLRNTDDESPCQLCVRFGEKNMFDEDDGGLMIALTKTNAQDFE